MHAVGATDIVLMVRVDSVVEENALLDGAIDKRLTMLPDDSAVHAIVDDEQTSLETADIIDNAVIGIAVWILLRGVHIAFAIHDLIVFPVADGSTCDTGPELIWETSKKRKSHEATETPAMDADARGVDIGERLEIADTDHLVVGLADAELAMDSLLEKIATELSATVIH